MDSLATERRSRHAESNLSRARVPIGSWQAPKAKSDRGLGLLCDGRELCFSPFKKIYIYSLLPSFSPFLLGAAF